MHYSQLGGLFNKPQQIHIILHASKLGPFVKVGKGVFLEKLTSLPKSKQSQFFWRKNSS